MGKCRRFVVVMAGNRRRLNGLNGLNGAAEWTQRLTPDA